MIEKLEKFQAELAEILKWPRHFSNTAATTAVELRTMRCRVLKRNWDSCSKRWEVRLEASA